MLLTLSLLRCSGAEVASGTVRGGSGAPALPSRARFCSRRPESPGEERAARNDGAEGEMCSEERFPRGVRDEAGILGK